ncbi:lantibiotic dehydratase [Virgibacillus sp.]|uniref:lantibiotic dehydratase n=1 Tax=Virgibacillus sp. TaxID=1872700 RepID=UPI001846F7F8|nr:lantibiotic dehydratase [Virgibacillus sp.]NWO15015.1 lantibiotic dehydratase [Virgibacillus sp.]
MLTKGKNTISELVLARVSVNQVSMLEQFIFSGSKEILHQIHMLEQEIDNIKETVRETIYTVIPTIHDKKLSGKLIRLRRKIFNNKAINLNAVKNIINALPNEITFTKTIMEQWIKTEDALISVKKEFQQLYQQEITKNEEQLWNIFHDDKSEFARGMPIVNSTFSSFLNSRKRKDYKRLDSNFHKSIYSYFLRSVVKTSPISTFTQLTLSGFHPNEWDFKAKDINIRWLRGLVSHLFETLANNKEFLPFFQFKGTDSIETQDGNLFYIRGNYSAIREVFSKTEDVFSYNEFLDIIRTLPSLSFTYDQLVAQIDHPHPETIATFLIDQKLIRPIMPCSFQDNAPFKSIANYIEKGEYFKVNIHGSVAEKLIRLDKLREKLEVMKSKSGRDALIERVKHQVEEIYYSLEVSVPTWLHNHELVYEDKRFKKHVPHLGEYLKNDLIELQHSIKPFMYRHALYNRLINKFEQLYGEGGKVKVLEFLCTVIESETEYSDLIKSALNDDIQNVMRQTNIYEANKGESSATVYYQIVSQSHKELLQGNYLIVINKVTDGNGSIFSRFNPLFDENSYKNKIVEWIKQRNDGKISYEFSVGGDWANVQEKYEILPDQLKWIGELPNSYEEQHTKIGVTDLNLSIKDGNFVISDMVGREIKPVYLGSVPEHLSVDLSKLFFTIIKPWYIRTPYGSNPLNKPQVKDDVTHIPRYQKGKIVFEREKWVVKIDIMKEILEQYKRDVLFHKLNSWRIMHQLPEEVFFTLESDSSMGTKPMWFHFLSIPCINLLKRSVTSKYQYITFTEALPSTKQQWLDYKGEKHVSEYMSLLSV